KLAWLRGLKTTYYLRTMAATHVEKSTVAHGALNAVPTGGAGSGGSSSGGAQGAAGGFGAAGGAASSSGAVDAAPALAPVEADGPVCTMRPGDPGFDECEACQ
ncbi:MAG: ribonucleoside-diphosphate reductase subunit alpha, partial [Burkholderia sp.]|nr:ribonucleoside-diphosphate reductase subunit alpha [Burkholderia sp.]